MTEHLPDADKRKYITLDDDELKELALTDPKLFMQLHPPPICIDEIQKPQTFFRLLNCILIKRIRLAILSLQGRRFIS